MWVLVSFLLGLGGSGVACGFVRLFGAQFDPFPETTFLVLAGFLFGVGVSPWMPQGMIRRVSSRVLARAMLARERATDKSPAPLTAHSATWGDDRELVLGSCCLLAGLATLSMAVLVGPVRLLCEWLRTDFFWTGPSLRIADLLVATGVQLVPTTLLGLALVCVLGVRADALSGRTTTLRLAALLCGAATGVWAVTFRYALGLTVSLTLVLSAVPLFLGCILALMHAGGGGRNSTAPGGRSPELDPAEAPPPEMGESGLSLLLPGLFVWSLSLAMTGVVWHRAALRGPTMTGVSPGEAIALWFVCLAVGAWLLCPRSARASQALGSVGFRMCLAGLCSAGVVLALSAEGQRVSSLALSGRSASWALLGMIGCHGVCNGMVLPAMLRAALSRFATRGLAHAKMVTVCALSMGTGFGILSLWVLGALGTLLAMCVCCLAMLITGGTMVIYDPRGGRKMHRVRLGGVFACLALLMFALPRAASDWSLDRTGASGDLREDVSHALEKESVRVAGADQSGNEVGIAGSTSVGGFAGGDSRGAVADLLAVCLPGSKVCVMGGVDTARFERKRGPFFRRIHVDHWPHPRDAAATRETNSSLSRLRTERTRYDLVICNSAGNGVRANQYVWAEESFRRLALLLAPQGVAIVRVPAETVHVDDLRTIARTFGGAFGGRSTWMAYGAGSEHEPELWLIGLGRSASAGADLLSRIPEFSARQPIGLLLAGAGPSLTHSIEHPRLEGSIAASGRPDGAPFISLLSSVRE